MPITINGSGTVTGISAGGLPDASIVTADIADANITAAKLSGAQTGTAPIYGCRAWVNFDGTRNEADTGPSTDGANVKIRAGGNVSSVRKNGAGFYLITLTTALTDANYCILACAVNSGVAGAFAFTEASTSSTATVQTASRLAAGSNADVNSIYVAIFR